MKWLNVASRIDRAVAVVGAPLVAAIAAGLVVVACARLGLPGGDQGVPPPVEQSGSSSTTLPDSPPLPQGCPALG